MTTYTDAQIDVVAKLIADKCGNGMREKYEDVARQIVEALTERQAGSSGDVPSTEEIEALGEFVARHLGDKHWQTFDSMRRALKPPQPPTEQAREAFQAWAAPKGYSLHTGIFLSGQRDEYSDDATERVWRIWQDALSTRATSATSSGVDEVARDAERYRQIRKGLSEHYGDVYGMVFDPEGDYPAAWDDLDKHVDAAIQSAARG